MKRMTSSNYNPCVNCIYSSSCPHIKYNAPVCSERARYDRLAAYEDTGLEPEEIAKIREDVENGYMKSTARRYGISIDRLRELAKADREGRCVVPPCKVGQKVKVDVRTWGNVWNYKTVENGKFLIGEIVAITKTKKQTLVKIRVEHNVSWKRPTRRYPASAIGKTVFLTRAEAEAALRREQE